MKAETLRGDALVLLSHWFEAAEAHWSEIPGHPEWGVYGTGYNNWGVQTTQKYIAAAAALSCYGEPEKRIHYRERALAALRFNLASHQSGPAFCTDRTKWGHTWISALGIERMMFGVNLLRPHFTEQDHAALRGVLASEADWLLHDYHRGSHHGIAAGQWNRDGRNDPESNIWNGALLWRTAQAYPSAPQAGDWKARACDFLVNGVSVPADETRTDLLDGKPVGERFVGANFFPNYALDHHAYLNVGYMVICVSNAAILHFDLKTLKQERPESLDHHQADLWQVLRRMIFQDGRLARIGGDTRVRYAYCQDYLLPALLYAADHLGDAHALSLAGRQLELIKAEAAYSADGSFYGSRLAALKDANPQYYTRLESDRACVLGMLLAYQDEVKPPPEAAQDFESSVSGAWCEQEHGAALHRGPTRLASFAWRANGLAQGLCLPPDNGHLAEWEHTLAGQVEFAHFPHPLHGQRKPHRRLLEHHIDEFEGGFLTYGSLFEGVDIELAEGWQATDSARHQIVWAALPDGHSVVGMQFCRMGNRRGYVRSIKGLQFNLPNDLYNGNRRLIETARGSVELASPATREESLSLKSAYANIENRIGLVGLYGGGELTVHRHPGRRAGELHSLFIEEICHPAIHHTRKYEAGEVILDTGWAALAAVDLAATRRFHESHSDLSTAIGLPSVRAIRVRGVDGQIYWIAANFGEQDANLAAGKLDPAPLRSLTQGKPIDKTLHLKAGQAVILLGEN